MKPTSAQISFVGIIRAEMKAQNISQWQLAKKLGHSKQYVSALLSDKQCHNLTIETMHKLAHAVGLRLHLQVIKA